MSAVNGLSLALFLALAWCVLELLATRRALATADRRRRIAERQRDDYRQAARLQAAIRRHPSAREHRADVVPIRGRAL